MNAISRAGRWLRRIGEAWSILGVTLLFFLVLEFGYRGVTAVRGAIGSREGRDSSLHPYAGEAWFREMQGPHGLQARRNRFDPYRMFWPEPIATRYVNIDSAGHRLTPQPPFDSSTAQRVFLLGGSTVWGYTSRDSFTIASLTAQRLAALGLSDIEVVNLGQAAFNSTQEAITLLLELTRGRRPSAAVFIDGYNDIETSLHTGEPGHTYGEDGVQQQILQSSQGFWPQFIGLGRQSKIVQTLLSSGGSDRPDPVPERSLPALCTATGTYYRDLARSIEALGKEYGFTPLFFQVPMLATSGKKPSRWERTLPPSRREKVCAAVMDSVMRASDSTHYRSLAAIFDGDTGSVFLDAHAHVTEAANGVIADRVAAALAPILRRPRAR